MELERALKESMKTWEQEGQNNQGGGDDEGGPGVGYVQNAKKDDKPKFEGQAVMMGGGGQKSDEPQMTPEEIALMNEFKDDPEMFQAMLMSMREERMNQI